jgi:hypothetical protein
MIPISVNVESKIGNLRDIPIDEMINRTFHIYPDDTDKVRQAKTIMTEIAYGLLGQMLRARGGTGFEKGKELFVNEHRQQKVMRQELVFNTLLGYPSKFQASVPISKIYATPDPYKIIKQLTVLTPENASKFFIIKELTFQIYAHEISTSNICNIVIPQIYGIQFYVNQENNLVCEFEMDIKDKLPLDFMLEWINRNEENDKDKLLAFINGVKQGFNCLNDHGIYHNDSHSNNVFFLMSDTDSDIPKVCIIDFGKAMCSSISPSTSGLTKLDEFEYPEDIIKNFKIWININESENKNKYRKMFDERYGGNQHKPRKTYRRRKNYRKKGISRKTYRKKGISRKRYRKTYKKDI